MPRRRATLPQGLPTYFSASRARQRGLVRKQINGPLAVIVSQGIRMRRLDAPDQWHLASVLQDIHPDGVFSHLSAADMWGMWLPWKDSGHNPIHLSKTRQSGGSPRRKGVQGHVLPAAAVIRTINGLRVTAPAWTWFDLAGTHLSDENLIADGDSLLQRHDGPSGQGQPGMHPLSTVDELRRTAEQRPGIRGIQRARAAVDRLRPGVDSRPESVLRQRMVQDGFPDPTVNPQIRLAEGTIMRPDLAWTHLKICIQYEGDHHRTDKDQFRRDTGRDRAMQSDGWIVLRVTGEVFTEIGWAQFVQDLKLALAGRA
ncbi:endonuclease domain-containing protein [Microbacterium sp. A93]|uniref:endonuclease domain-containing protein n=1 Tax=Microbacterium sp. A93 TaxID=3450716 RepID=UPI003F435401